MKVDAEPSVTRLASRNSFSTPKNDMKSIFKSKLNVL